MTLPELIKEYQEQTAICANTDYSDKESVKAHNAAVTKMYKLVDILKVNFQRDDINHFAQLLDVSKNKTNLWVAAQMLERLTLEKDIESKALSIITEVAIGNGVEATGFQMWLRDWRSKNNSTI